MYKTGVCQYQTYVIVSLFVYTFRIYQQYV